MRNVTDQNRKFVLFVFPSGGSPAAQKKYLIQLFMIFMINIVYFASLRSWPYFWFVVWEECAFKTICKKCGFRRYLQILGSLCFWPHFFLAVLGGGFTVSSFRMAIFDAKKMISIWKLFYIYIIEKLIVVILKMAELICTKI